MFIYNAKVVNVVDGDTLDVMIDLGFKIWVKKRIRLAGIDVYESRLGKHTTAALKIKGLQAKEFVKNEVLSLENVILQSAKDKTGKFGRWLGDVNYNGKSLVAELRKMGFEKQ